jgi:nicotinamidase-related amidase
MKTMHSGGMVWQGLLLACLIGVFTLFPPFAAYAETVLDAWATIKTPPAPAPQAVTVDPKTTALLLLDFNRQVCNSERRPRCIASVPGVAKLLAAARGKGMLVVYSLTAGSKLADVAPALAAREGDPAVTSGPDKFLGTDLEKILAARGIKTVIVTGTAAHGAVLNTASGAAFRGMKVILPVDGLSAEGLYPEQYTVWHLLNAPRVSTQVTLTAIDLMN